MLQNKKLNRKNINHKKMAKNKLNERFQQLAGIKPLYETGNLHEFGIITEQSGGGNIPDCYLCDTSSGQPALISTPAEYNQAWCAYSSTGTQQGAFTWYSNDPCYSYYGTGNGYTTQERCIMGQTWGGAQNYQGYYGHINQADVNGGQGCVAVTTASADPDCFGCVNGSVDIQPLSVFVGQTPASITMCGENSTGTIYYVDQAALTNASGSCDGTPPPPPPPPPSTDPCDEFETLYGRDRRAQEDFCEGCNSGIVSLDPMCECCPEERGRGRRQENKRIREIIKKTIREFSNSNKGLLTERVFCECDNDGSHGMHAKYSQYFYDCNTCAECCDGGVQADPNPPRTTPNSPGKRKTGLREGKKIPLNELYYCNSNGEDPTTHPRCRKRGAACINWEENTAGTMGTNIDDPNDWQCIPNEVNLTPGSDGPSSADGKNNDIYRGNPSNPQLSQTIREYYSKHALPIKSKHNKIQEAAKNMLKRKK